MAPIHFILMTATLLLGKERTEATGQHSCISDKAVHLSLSHLTNASGHTILNGRLEQPSEAAWQLDVDLRTSRGASARSQVLSFSLAGAAGKASVRVPPGYALREGFGYFRAGSHALEWTAARDACARDGAALAFANSQEEALMLATQFNFDVPGSGAKNLAWYGASDLAEEGKYVTVTELTLSETGYATYSPGAPQGKRSENCIFLYKNNGLLDDGNCPTPLAYICKVPL